MIGLLFFGAITIWGVVAFALGSKIPQLLGVKRHRTAIGFAFALLLFVAPVADEIIAWPQMQALCASQKPFQLVSGMSIHSAHGRTVEQTLEISELSLWPSSVKATQWDLRYVDVGTKETILEYTRFQPRRGMLGIPNGSSGGQMTALLRNCIDVDEPYDSSGLPVRFENLQLKHSAK